MDIKKLVIITGVGRSGTTILYKLLSVHPEICWFSNYSNKFNNIKYIPIIHKILELPIIGDILKSKIVNKRKYEGRIRIKPVEAQNIYHDYCGFSHKKKRTSKDFDLAKVSCPNIVDTFYAA